MRRGVVAVLLVAVLVLLASLVRGHNSTPTTSPSTTASTTVMDSSTTTVSTTIPPTTIIIDQHGGDGLSPFTPALQSFIQKRGGTSVDAAILDLTTGATYHYSLGSRPHVDASIVKVALLEALLAKNLGTLPPTSQALAQSMIEVSSNSATTQLWNNLGGTSALSEFDTGVGLTDTVVSKCVACPGFPWPGWGLTTTHALDQLILLRLIAESNQWLSDADRSYVSSLMSHVIASERWGISAGVPSQSFVQLKNGWLPLKGQTDWDVNSIGWIRGAGRNYMAVVLTSGNPSMGYGIETIETISREFWRSRAANPGTSTTTVH